MWYPWEASPNPAPNPERMPQAGGLTSTLYDRLALTWVQTWPHLGYLICGDTDYGEGGHAEEHRDEDTQFGAEVRVADS